MASVAAIQIRTNLTGHTPRGRLPLVQRVRLKCEADLTFPGASTISAGTSSNGPDLL